MKLSEYLQLISCYLGWQVPGVARAGCSYCEGHGGVGGTGPEGGGAGGGAGGGRGGRSGQAAQGGNYEGGKMYRVCLLPVLSVE